MHDLDGHFVVRHSIARTIAAGVAAGAAMNTVFRVLRAVEPLRGAARADGGRARVLGVHRLRRGVRPGRGDGVGQHWATIIMRYPTRLVGFRVGV